MIQYSDPPILRREMPDVLEILNRDLAEKSAGVRIDLDNVEDPALILAVREVYPEAEPIGREPSIFPGA